MWKRLQNAAWIALFTCLVLGFSIAVWHSNQIAKHYHEQQAKTKYQNGQVGPPIADSIKQEKGGARTSEKGDNYHIAEWLIAFFNGLLVFVTYRLVTTTGDLRRSTDKLWAAGEQQIAVALIAANAAEKSAEAARAHADAAIASNRPYMFVERIKQSYDPQWAYIDYRVQNIGESVAIMEEYSMDLRVFERVP